MRRVSDNFHSTVVAWMKIILPLGALGLFSTLFLLSNPVDLTNSIPVAQVDLERRAQDQGVTNPSFAGVATGGEQVSFKAAMVRPDPENDAHLLADLPRAQMHLIGGAVIDIRAETGESDQVYSTVKLMDDVRIFTTTGYDIRTDLLTAEFDTLRAESPGPVTGKGPPGDLSAGAMVLVIDAQAETAHLRFTDGVKLIYTPQQIKD
ncbi:LPS export ABC transporter periplasmic protein LptC [Rhodobacteraceae bacterium KMM 6894]|nr:LPS export ABC transporter periplasmic protein LptC [Rhodobacteraceae bacterium KMM 6894]